jgi:hypothetical protein
MLRILTFCLFFLLHPVHVSITSIDYNPEISAFKVFIRMYFDDFLLDSKLNINDFQKENLSTTNSSAKRAINAYINEMVIINADKIQLSARLKDFRLADNEINIYLDYPIEKSPGTVTVKSLIMTNLYGDQSNMVILKVNDFEEGVKLNPDLTERTFIIK